MRRAQPGPVIFTVSDGYGNCRVHKFSADGKLVSEIAAVDSFTLVRMIAAARVLMPASRVRLSAGRRSLSREATALCFLAGANSIFVGEKLLTTPNPERDEDDQLLRDLGLRASAHGPALG